MKNIIITKNEAGDYSVWNGFYNFVGHIKRINSHKWRVYIISRCYDFRTFSECKTFFNA